MKMDNSSPGNVTRDGFKMKMDNGSRRNTTKDVIKIKIHKGSPGNETRVAFKVDGSSPGNAVIDDGLNIETEGFSSLAIRTPLEENNWESVVPHHKPWEEKEKDEPMSNGTNE